MSASTKRKVSGLSGLELDMSLTRLRKFRSTLIVEDVSESDTSPTDPLADQLDNIICTLESRARNPLFLSFSAVDAQVLARFNIVRNGMLFLQSDVSQAIATSRTAGSDRLWSNAAMYHHLSYLVNAFANKNESSARTLIDTFFFRSTSMVPAPRKVIVMQKKQIPAIHLRPSQMDTISGVIDNAIVVADESIAKTYIRSPPEITQHYGKSMIAFFVTVAKVTSTGDVSDYLPRVLLELVACARHLRRSHIRGALTNGFKWHFIALDLDVNGDGARYWLSDLIEWRWKTKPGLDPVRLIEDTESEPALIAGILSSWIQESFDEFKGDQWFYTSVT